MLVAFHKNEEGQLEGVINTLLPDKKYEFSIYALNSTSMNTPSAYSLPIQTRSFTGDPLFTLFAASCTGKTPAITTKYKFGNCKISITYNDRKYVTT